MLVSLLSVGCTQNVHTFNQHNKNGEKKGMWVQKYRNEYLEYSHYRKDKKKGISFIFDSNGELKRVAKYKNGKLNGEVSDFHNGTLYRSYSYKNDSLIEEYNIVGNPWQ